MVLDFIGNHKAFLDKPDALFDCDKLLAGILANPQKVRFDDACRVARSLGFVHEGGRGSHRVFKRRGEPTQLNFQDRDGLIPPYQARQLVAMIEKYGAER